MKDLYRKLAGATLAILLPSVAAAATIATPMMFPGGVDFLECVANNVGTVPISSVTVTVVDANNVVLDSTSCSALAPSDYCLAGGTTNTGGFCRVTFTGLQKNLRAALTMTDGTTGAPKAVLAAE